ncbi:arylamine N-acetyltransferase [Pseudonocardia zijingensis]|uniref:Arylamine N-acetyltransferase n=1 Tax=Pseudonocardia zijingensis TaxID=153376 RepID=A0ABN1PGE1_9PSEU
MCAALPAYLDRIGSPEVTGADLPTLRRIVAAHARSIAFENLDAFTGREVALDPEALDAKIVRGGRGGWCFEQNLLLRGALDAIGYTTTGLAARVMWTRPADAPPVPRSHMLLRVDLPEGPHLVDVGFGGLTLTGVLTLQPDVEQPTPHETFRLVPAERDGYVMQARLGAEWRPLYWFDLTEQLAPDYEVSNWYLCHHPQSHFRSGIMIARPEPDRRYALSGTRLSVHHLDGPAERHDLETPAEIRKAIEETFLIDTTGLPDLEAQLGRLVES